jgi:hypothetical protein
MCCSGPNDDVEYVTMLGTMPRAYLYHVRHRVVCVSARVIVVCR